MQQVEVNHRGSPCGMEALAEFSFQDQGCLLFLPLPVGLGQTHSPSPSRSSPEMHCPKPSEDNRCLRMVAVAVPTVYSRMLLFKCQGTLEMLDLVALPLPADCDAGSPQSAHLLSTCSTPM